MDYKVPQFEQTHNYILVGASGSGKSFIYDKLPKNKKIKKASVNGHYILNKKFYYTPRGIVSYSSGINFDIEHYIKNMELFPNNCIMTVVCFCPINELKIRLKKRLLSNIISNPLKAIKYIALYKSHLSYDYNKIFYHLTKAKLKYTVLYTGFKSNSAKIWKK